MKESNGVQSAGTEKFLTWQYLNIMLTDLTMRISMYMLTTLIPLYMIERGLITFAGLTTTVFMLTAVVIRPFAGKLVDRRGRVEGIVVGASAFLIATILISFDVPDWFFLVMRGLQGLGFSFFGTAVMTMATDIIPEGRMSEGIGYLGLTQTIGRAFAPLLALEIKSAMGYQIAFLVVFGIAAVTVISGISLIFSRRKKSKGDQESHKFWEESPKFSNNQKKIPFWQKIVERNALKHALIMFSITFSTSSVLTFFVGYAISKGIGNPGLFFTANAIMIAVSRLSVGKISQKFGSVAVLTPGIALIGLSLFGMFSSANMTVLILSGALYGLGFGMVQPELNSLCVLSAQKDQRGLANSTFFMAMDLGNAAGAMTWGILASITGLGTIFVVAALVTGLTLLTYLFFWRQSLVRVEGLTRMN